MTSETRHRTVDERVHRDADIDRIASELQSVRDGENAREDGVFVSRMDDVESTLLSFGRAIGGDPDTTGDLPFTEEAGTDGMPEPLYVRQDAELLDQVTSWLLQGQHIGLVSPYGTGKTALREIAVRDLGRSDDFVVTQIQNPRETTVRQFYETILEASFEAGYEIDPDDYWQVKNGIPWATNETKQAVREIAGLVEHDDRTLLVLVDEIEDLPKELLGPLQTAADAGVRLFLLGTPTGKQRLADFRETLDSRVRYYEGIAPFDASDVAEYVGRSLAYFRDEDYTGGHGDLFTTDAIVDVYERTDGNPRQVRLECMDLFARAAFVWERSGTDAARINITPALRDRSMAMGE